MYHIVELLLEYIKMPKALKVYRADLYSSLASETFDIADKVCPRHEV